MIGYFGRRSLYSNFLQLDRERRCRGSNPRSPDREADALPTQLSTSPIFSFRIFYNIKSSQIDHSITGLVRISDVYCIYEVHEMVSYLSKIFLAIKCPVIEGSQHT